MKRQADLADSAVSNPVIPPPPLYLERYKCTYIPSKYMANFNSPQRQNFSLPAPLIRFITFNPTEKAYVKMVETCKYFYSVNPVFLFLNLNFVNGPKWTICNDPTCPKRHEFKLFNIPTKIWVTETLKIKNESKDLNIASTLITKLYRCDVKVLILTNQNLTLKEFLFLTKNVHSLVFHNGVISDDNNNAAAVPLEKIVESVPKLLNFYYSFNDQATDITPNSVKKLLQLKRVKELKYFDLCQIPEIFDFKTFFEFMNKNKQIHFHLCFRHQVSNAYRNQIESYKSKIKNEKFEGVDPPEIFFL